MSKAPQAGQTLNIKGQDYVVVSAAGPDASRPNTAEAMERRGFIADVWMRKPRGRKAFQTWAHKDGGFTNPISIPGLVFGDTVVAQ